MEIKFFNGKEYHLVTLRGRTKWIASDGDAINPCRKAQKCTTYKNTDGYLCFGGGVPVHLYVAHGWVPGYSEGKEVNHKDFNILNNNAENLEWITHRENVQYSVKNNSEVWNKSKQGIHNGRCTFTEEQVLDIRRKYAEGKSIAEIVKEYHPDLKTSKQYKSIHSTFSNICHRKTWKNI